jgi:tRNA(Ile)-lysidine synthase
MPLTLGTISARRLLVACSGGPDSMALLEAADNWRKERGTFVAVGHINHGLRGQESRGDAVFVREQSRRRALPVAVVSVPVRAWARRRGRGLEDAARELRYAALARLARRFRCSAVATAHTLDDQVETVFLNLLRGTGPGGLAAMAEHGPWPVPVKGVAPVLLRPFLAVRKSVLVRYLTDRGLGFRKDITNDQPIFLRNRLRPVLRSWERLRPGFFERVAQTARLVRDEEDFWRGRLGLRRKELLSRLDRASFLRYHVAEQRRRLRHRYGLSRFDVVERVRRFCADATPGPLDVPGGRVTKTGRFLHFSRRKKQSNGISKKAVL